MNGNEKIHKLSANERFARGERATFGANLSPFAAAKGTFVRGANDDYSEPFSNWPPRS